MSRYLRFSDLSIGQSVSVSGKAFANIGFVAVEITRHDHQLQGRIKAEIESLDPIKRTLTALGQNVVLNETTRLRGREKQLIEFEAFCQGQLVKIKCDQLNSSSVLASRIDIDETLEFNIEQIEGKITKIQKRSNTLTVNGIIIRSNEETVIFTA